MHEYSIIQSLVDAVEKSVWGTGYRLPVTGDRLSTGNRQPATGNLSRVHRIDVCIGELSGVDTGLLATAYEVFRAGTCCESATMKIDRVPAHWQCPKCSSDIARGAVLRCPTCKEPARLMSGDEIILQRIELEVP
ncbi:MAG TPA: hydrogenase maturation nickel metallochaperone HypA [Thermoanaerobaculia bacterium]